MARLVDADKIIKDLTAMKKAYDAIELDGMIKALQEAPTMEPKQELINARDELPKRRREYLCIYQFGDNPIYRYYGVLMFHPEQDGDNGYVKGPHFSDEGMDGMKVVYWMPLPKMPELTKEEKENG